MSFVKAFLLRGFDVLVKNLNIAQMNEITIECVKQFLSANTLEFEPSQDKISFPILQRIHRRLQMGHVFDPIKVTEKAIISDGHHRFVCLSILGSEVITNKAAANHDQLLYNWSDVIVQPNDYDSDEKKQEFEAKYG